MDSRYQKLHGNTSACVSEWMSEWVKKGTVSTTSNNGHHQTGWSFYEDEENGSIHVYRIIGHIFFSPYISLNRWISLSFPFLTLSPISEKLDETLITFLSFEVSFHLPMAFFDRYRFFQFNDWFSHGWPKPASWTVLFIFQCATKDSTSTIQHIQIFDSVWFEFLSSLHWIVKVFIFLNLKFLRLYLSLLHLKSISFF